MKEALWTLWLSPLGNLEPGPWLKCSNIYLLPISTWFKIVKPIDSQRMDALWCQTLYSSSILIMACCRGLATFPSKELFFFFRLHGLPVPMFFYFDLNLFFEMMCDEKFYFVYLYQTSHRWGLFGICKSYSSLCDDSEKVLSWMMYFLSKINEIIFSVKK